MTHTIKTKATPRSNVRKNWKRKVNRSWKQEKKTDPSVPYLPRDWELGSTFKIDSRNLEFWESHFNKKLWSPYDPSGDYRGRSAIPSNHELSMVKKLLIQKYRGPYSSSHDPQV
jgi:hypothetical protein